MNGHFDLRYEPWIPVMLKGETQLVGLRKVLSDAHRYDGLGCADPIDEPAVLRVLLAVVHHATKGPTDIDHWATLWDQDKFPDDLTDRYFSDRDDGRFDLFDDKRPFMQNRSLTGRAKPFAVLSPKLSSGTSEMFLDHTDTWKYDSRTTEGGFTPGEAALELVVGHAYQLNYRGVSPGALIKGAVVYNTGRNLFETIMLNLVLYQPEAEKPMPGSAEDRPVWDQADSSAAERSPRPLGYLDYLTWQPKHVQLQKPNPRTGLIQKVRTGPGSKFPEAFKNAYTGTDPMLPCRYTADGQDARAAKIPVDFDTAAWRNIGPLLNRYAGPPAKNSRRRPQILDWRADLVLDLDLDLPKTIAVVTTGTPPIPGALHWWRREDLLLPAILLNDNVRGGHITDAVKLADDAEKAIKQATRILAENILGINSNRESTTVKRLRRQLAPARLFWDRLGAAFPALVDDVTRSDSCTQESQETWRIGVREAAEDAFEDMTGRFEGSYLGAVTQARNMLTSKLRKLTTSNHQGDQ